MTSNFDRSDYSLRGPIGRELDGKAMRIALFLEGSDCRSDSERIGQSDWQIFEFEWKALCSGYVLGRRRVITSGISWGKGSEAGSEELTGECFMENRS